MDVLVCSLVLKGFLQALFSHLMARENMSNQGTVPSWGSAFVFGYQRYKIKESLKNIVLKKRKKRKLPTLKKSLQCLGISTIENLTMR